MYASLLHHTWNALSDTTSSFMFFFNFVYSPDHEHKSVYIRWKYRNRIFDSPQSRGFGGIGVTQKKKADYQRSRERGLFALYIKGRIADAHQQKLGKTVYWIFLRKCRMIMSKPTSSIFEKIVVVLERFSKIILVFS